MVVVSVTFVSFPGDFEPVCISYGNVETASKGLRREFRDEITELSPGIFRYGEALIKIVHVPFINFLQEEELRQLRELVSAMRRSKSS